MWSHAAPNEPDGSLLLPMTLDPWSTRETLRASLLAAIHRAPPSPNTAPDAVRRWRHLVVALSLGGTRDLDLQRLLTRPNTPMAQITLLISTLAEEGRQVPRAWIDDAISRILSVDQPHETWHIGPALQVLDRSVGEAGAAAVAAVLATLPPDRLDALVARGIPLGDATREALYQRWTETGPRPGERSWQDALYGSLTRPRSRSWILEGDAPLDPDLLAEAFAEWPDTAILDWFAGYPHRLAEARRCRILPPWTDKDAAEALFSEVRHHLMAMRQWNTRRCDAFAPIAAAVLAEGPRVQIRIAARVKGGFRVVLALQGARCVGFLPKSQTRMADPRPGAVAWGTVIRLKRRRNASHVIVSQEGHDAADLHIDPEDRWDLEEPEAEPAPIWHGDASLRDAIHEIFAAPLPDAHRQIVALTEGGWWATWANVDRDAALAWGTSGPLDGRLPHTMLRWMQHHLSEIPEGVAPWLDAILAGGNDPDRRRVIRLWAPHRDVAWLYRWCEDPPLEGVALTALAAAGEDVADRLAPHWLSLSSEDAAMGIAAVARTDPRRAVQWLEDRIAANVRVEGDLEWVRFVEARPLLDAVWAVGDREVDRAALAIAVRFGIPVSPTGDPTTA